MRLKAFHRAILLVLAAAAATAALWWKCRHDPAINFLPSDSRAEWILFPAPVQAGAHRIAMLDTVFRKQFQLNNGPTFARLQLRAARRLELKINSKPVDVAAFSNWKDIAIVDVLPFLQTGSNTIEARVFNDEAPPALWFQLSADKMQIRSDATWEASLAGSAWRPAWLAWRPRNPRKGNVLAGGESTLEVFPKAWPLWAICGSGAFLIGLAGRRWFHGIGDQGGTAPGELSRWQVTLLLSSMAFLWVLLFWNNGSKLPFHTGYDSADHLAYIKYVQERHRLPLPNEGYEMFQPPLYYTLSAIALSVGRLSITDQSAVAVLRLLTMLFGIANFTLAFMSVRLIFPRRIDTQLVGLALAAFLPVQLSLSHYVTNEVLAGALVTATIYLALGILRREETSLLQYAWLGACLGAAMLAKTTSLLLFPALFGALALHLRRKQFPVATWTRSVGVTLFVCVAVCGWHYIRIWRHFGTPIVGNWDPAIGFAWWQDPGFHTARDYLRFGQSLVHPLFSGFNGFADGIYSTLWGDGLCGGLSDLLSRTLWNYDLMVAGYWIALLPSLLVVCGIAVATYRFCRETSPTWFLLLGLSGAMVVAVIFMTLRVPSYAQIKAFYGLSALVPFCSFGAVGWQILARRRAALRLVIAALLTIWAVNSFGSVWIHNAPLQHVYAARRWLARNEPARAMEEAIQAVKDGPSNSMAHCFLGQMLDSAGKWDEAIEQTKEGIQLDPTRDTCYLQLAITSAKRGQLEEAIGESHHALDLAPENLRAYDLLFTCLRQLNRPSEALAVGRDALALSPFDPDLHYRIGLAAGELGDFSTAAPQFAYALLLQPSRSEIEKKLHLAVAFAATSANAPDQLAAVAASAPESPALFNELAWVFSTDPNADVRNGVEAVRLSERACALTKRGQAKFVLTLAAAYAEAGRFSEAANAGQEALSLARSAGETSTSALVEKLLSSLQSNQAYREEPIP